MTWKYYTVFWKIELPNLSAAKHIELECGEVRRLGL